MKTNENDKELEFNLLSVYCEELESRLDKAELILQKLAFGYQSRNRYNELIREANYYFKEDEICLH